LVAADVMTAHNLAQLGRWRKSAGSRSWPIASQPITPLVSPPGTCATSADHAFPFSGSWGCCGHVALAKHARARALRIDGPPVAAMRG
jgi:hypothetical protein